MKSERMGEWGVDGALAQYPLLDALRERRSPRVASPATRLRTSLTGAGRAAYEPLTRYGGRRSQGRGCGTSRTSRPARGRFDAFRAYLPP